MKTQHIPLAKGVCFVLAILFAGCTFYGCHAKEETTETADPKTVKLDRLSHYSAEGEWDKIIEECADDATNALFISYRNRALAEKGALADQLFRYPQCGASGLMPAWNSAPEVSALLSDLYFTIGAIAASQRMAFEALVGTHQRLIKQSAEQSPEMLRRLIQTNLIYGAYPVAEKYLSVLEHSGGHEEWCAQYRAYLYNDAKVAADPLLGAKRRCISAQDYFVQLNNLEHDLRNIAHTNPQHRAAIQYLGCKYLLGKDLPLFRQLIEENYQTPTLPDMPRNFQEAVIILSEADTAYWHKYGVTEATTTRFNEYKKTLLTNRGNANISHVMRQRFGDSFWYYFMFTK